MRTLQAHFLQEACVQIQSIKHDQILLLKEKLNQILVRHTEQPYEKIERDTDRDRYMSAVDAKEYGIVDHVVTERLSKTKGDKGRS